MSSKSSCLRIAANYCQQISTVKGTLYCSLNNSKTKGKEEKKPISKAVSVSSLDSLIFRSDHSNFAGIREFQRKKRRLEK